MSLSNRCSKMAKKSLEDGGMNNRQNDEIDRLRERIVELERRINALEGRLDLCFTEH